MSEPAGAAAHHRAMVLAAGRGERMRPLTESRPKALIEVAGRTLIDHVLDRLAEAGIYTVVVNAHFMADALEHHLSRQRALRIVVLREPTLLDTGGGVKAALGRLGPDPFFVANSDSLWLDGPQNTLERMARTWNDSEMDALLLFFPTVRAEADYEGMGDYFLDQRGRMRRRREGEVAPFIFTGVQLLHPRLFAGSPEPPFSLNLLYDRAERHERLYGLVHDGLWIHVGTPQAVALAERRLGSALGPPPAHAV